MHIHDGELRAFIDGELDDASRERVRTHLDTCAGCRERLETLQAGLDRLDGQLKLLVPRPAQRPRADRALARLHAHIDTDHTLFAGGINVRRLGLSRNWQRALTGLAVAVIVAGLLAFAPVRAAASDLLSVFRLERIVVLPVSLYDVERLDRVSRELGSDYFPGRMETLVEPGDPQYPADLAEASQLAGFGLRAPATHPPADEIVLRSQTTTRFEPDVGDMRELFEAAELSPDLVPPEIDGQPFIFTMPVSVVQIWGAEGAEPLMLMQMPVPMVDFPDDVDEEALALAMLQLLGLSPDEAAALNASVDWSSTLLLPLPTDYFTADPVSVDGVEGFLLTGTPPDDEEDEDITYIGVLWQKNGVVNLVAGTEDANRMLEIANSLQ